jgi:hypothetical protein
MTTPYFHPDSKTVRFSVPIDGQPMGASITQATLHYRFRPAAVAEDPLETYTAHATEIHDAVRRRVAEGSLEPVMVREYDLRERHTT